MENYHYDSCNRLTVHDITDLRSAGHEHREYTYDAQGNMLNDGNRQYTYDALNRLEEVRNTDGSWQKNHYDGEGLRAELEENGRLVRFIFNGDKVAAEQSENNTIRYIRGYDLISSDSEAAKTYYHYACDELGSITHITDDEGNVLNRYEYDAFGNFTLKEETVENRFGFTGEQYDPVAGMYYLRARFYNPVIGRFIQEDTYYGDGLNLYAYCHNNPVGYLDPSGHACHDKETALKILKANLQEGADIEAEYQKYRANFKNAKETRAYLENKYNPLPPNNSQKGYVIVNCNDPVVNEVLLRVTINNGIPKYSKKNNLFQKWFNEVSCDDLDILYSNQSIKNIIKDQLRGSGGKHEFLNVANANIFKRMGATAEDIMNQTTYTKETFFDNILTNDGLTKVSGSHTGSSAGKYAHQQMDALVKSSSNMQEYVESLRIWSDEDNHLRVETNNGTLLGSDALPGFLKKGELLPDSFK